MAQVLARAAQEIQKDPDLGVQATVSQIQVQKDTAKTSISEVHFEVRDFTDRDYENSTDLISFFKRAEAIHGKVHLTDTMLRAWYSKHAA